MNGLCGYADLSTETHGARDPHDPVYSQRMGSLEIRILSRSLSQEGKTEQIEPLKSEMLLQALACFEHWEDHA